MKIENSENSKIRKLFPVPQLPRKGFVAQTWSWAPSLISDAKCRLYDPKRKRFTPKGGKTGLGKTALVKTGRTLLSQ